jgi:hypothetical protein
MLISALIHGDASIGKTRGGSGNLLSSIVSRTNPPHAFSHLANRLSGLTGAILPQFDLSMALAMQLQLRNLDRKTRLISRDIPAGRRNSEAAGMMWIYLGCRERVNGTPVFLRSKARLNGVARYGDASDRQIITRARAREKGTEREREREKGGDTRLPMRRTCVCKNLNRCGNHLLAL